MRLVSRTSGQPWIRALPNLVAIALCALICTGLATPTRAQEEAVAERLLQVQNLAPEARNDWVSVSVPFRPGEVTELPDLHVDGLPTVWQPFGARHIDGSIRQALCFFRPELGSLGSTTFALVPGSGPELGEPELSLPPHALRFTTRIRGETTLAELRVTETLESNAARQVDVLRGRFGETGLVAEIVLTRWSGQDTADLAVAAFFSDPRSKAMEVQIEELAIETDGLSLVFRHARPLGIDSEYTETGSRHVLLRGDSLADGQGLRRVGVLAIPIPEEAENRERREATVRAAALCPPLAGTSWVGTDAFGPLGVVPEPPKWMRDPSELRAELAARHRRYASFARTASPDPFRAPRLGPQRRPSTAGNQADFGISALWEVACSGLASPLLEVEWSVLQEACRPTHFFEVDATPIQAARHPKWVVWTGRTHWNCKVSTDRLGKPCPEPKYDTHGYRGKDREHWSSNYLGAFYQLTGAPWALLQLRTEGQLWLGGETLRQGLYTSKPGAARAAGRTMHSGCWILLATDDPLLRQRMRARMIQVNLPSWRFAETPADRLRPFQVKGPDRRYFENSQDGVWVPWEESQTVMGFEAYLRTTGDDDAKLRGFVDAIALNILRHGYRENAKGQVEIGYVMNWSNGTPPVGDEIDDPKRVKWNTNFSTWGVPSLVAARLAAERANESVLVQKADRLLERLQASRRAPRSGGADDMTRWDARRLLR